MLFAAIAAMACLGAQAQEVVRLYDGEAPGSEALTDPEMTISLFDQDTRYINISTPTLEVYLPNKWTANGAAMVVCPGGGFRMLSFDSEGRNVAKCLAENGVAAFVLKYRTLPLGTNEKEAQDNVLAMFAGFSENPPELTASQKMVQELQPKVMELAGDDGRKAIAYVRANAEKYGIDPDRIGIVGFSAGSRVALEVCFNHDADSKPNLVAPIYGSREAEAVPEDAAPLFIVAPEYDLFGEPMTASSLFSLWQQSQVAAEAHYFANSSHGFGYKGGTQSTDIWMELLLNFMKTVGFVK